MRGDFVRVVLEQCRRKIALQIARKIGIVRHFRSHQLVIQVDLGIGEQNGKFGARQTLVLLAAFFYLQIIGQELDFSIQLTGAFEVAHQALLKADIGYTPSSPEADGQCLQVIILKTRLGHFLGHLRQESVAFFCRELARGNRRAHCYLDIYFLVGGIDASRVVDRVGIDAAPCSREIDARFLRHPEVRALADDFHLEFVRLDPNGIVGAVANLFVRFQRASDIGADTAKPQEIELRLQQRPDQLARRHCVGFKPCELLDLTGQTDGFRRAAENAAPLADQLRIVVLPA